MNYLDHVHARSSLNVEPAGQEYYSLHKSTNTCLYHIIDIRSLSIMSDLEVLPVRERNTKIMIIFNSPHIYIFHQTGLKEVMKDDTTGLEVRIYYLECLAQATYIIMHQDSALIVDPRRDVDGFLQVRRE